MLKFNAINAKSCFLFCFLAGFFIQNLNAAVWVPTGAWDKNWEKSYQDWVKSPDVMPSMLTNPASPYYGLTVDCADFAYALHVIFAYEHGLPFRAKNPVAKKSDKMQYFSHEMTRWDKLAPNKRVVQFITYLADSLGTESLSYYDSYPIKVKTVTPSDIYLYKIKQSTGLFVRHSYIIKNINEKGNFDIIYSTQAAKAEGKPLYFHANQQIASAYAPIPGWGFKRQKLYQHYDLSTAPELTELDYSQEQYDLVKKLGAKEFFKNVRRGLQTSNESPQETVNRLMSNLCTQLKERGLVVESATTYLGKSKNSCMDFGNFDAYSTPSRDKGFKELYQDLRDATQDIRDLGKVSEVDSVSWNRVEAIFDPTKVDESVKSDLDQFCSINYSYSGSTYSMNLATTYSAFSSDKISFHPNDNIARRWGNSQGTRTTCKMWYGQE